MNRYKRFPTQKAFKEFLVGKKDKIVGTTGYCDSCPLFKYFESIKIYDVEVFSNEIIVDGKEYAVPVWVGKFVTSLDRIYKDMPVTGQQTLEVLEAVT